MYRSFVAKIMLNHNFAAKRREVTGLASFDGSWATKAHQASRLGCVSISNALPTLLFSSSRVTGVISLGLHEVRVEGVPT